MRTLPVSLAGLCLLALACSGGDEVGGSSASLVNPTEDAATPEANPGQPPQGSWIYSEECGESAGGSPVMVGYALRITGTEVAVEADGFQTMLRAVGRASVDSSGVWSVQFERNAEDSFSGAYLNPGDVMLTFTVEDGDLQITPGQLIFNGTETTRFTREG